MNPATDYLEYTAPAPTSLPKLQSVFVSCQYPPAKFMEVPNPSYRQPFSSFPTLRSATLLLSFPQEILRLIFIHGASTLIPKPGASSHDSAVLDYYRKEYLRNASMVTSSWCVEAQLEMMYYTFCQSPEDLHSLVVMLEKTGRIKHLKRLSLTSGVNFEDLGMYFRSRYTTPSPKAPSNSTKLTIHLVKRLIKLGPVLDELEIMRGGDDAFLSCIPLLEDLQPGRTTEVGTKAVHKISERDNLYSFHTAMEMSTLILNRMRLDLNRTELDTLGKISEITSLVVMNSSYSDSATFPRLRCGDPGFIPSPFLVLTTLSLDRSELSMHLLRSNHFPAVTTFELIPGPTIHSDPEYSNLSLMLTALLKFPSLTKLILPLEFALINTENLLENFTKGKVQLELARGHKWNWLRYQERGEGETDFEESDEEEEI